MPAAEYEIFREQLAISYPWCGYAQWQPSPIDPNRPVQVGDVGFMFEGRFHRLFSALLPADHPSQELGVPEYHEPFVPTISNYLDTAPFGRNNYCSSRVKVEDEPGYHSSPNDIPQVLFQNEITLPAAVFSLPVMGRRENILTRNAFGRWMLKHIDAWFAFARNLELVHKMEDIILVTGCDLTRSWANIAFFGGRADAQVSFGVKVEGSTSNPRINFQSSPMRDRGAVLRHGPEGTDLPENQCAFIRGFRVSPSLYILPKRLKAAADPSPVPGGYDCDQDKGVISIPGIAQFRDPLHVLSDFIAEQASDCDKILVHDDDLLMIDGIGHGTLLETLEPNVMVDLLKKSDIKIQKFGCEDSPLAESQSGPNTDTSDVKVATLSIISRDWNPTPLSHGWSSLTRVPIAAVDFSHTSKVQAFLLPERDDSAPSTSRELCDSSALDRGQSAGTDRKHRLMYNSRQVGPGTGDPWDSCSSMNATGAESGPDLWLTSYFELKSAGGHGQDVESTGALPTTYSNATPRGPFFDSSSNLVDDADASQVSAMVSGNVHCPVCDVVLRRLQDRKRHILTHLPHWLHCPMVDCPWRGDRWDNLRKHHLKYHPSIIQGMDKNECMIYDPWRLVEGIKDETTFQNAKQHALSMLAAKAVEVGKLKLWEDNFGGRRKRKAQVHGSDDDRDLVPKAGHDNDHMCGV